MIAIQAVLGATDGHTLLAAPSSNVTVTPAIRKVPYKNDDLRPLSTAAIDFLAVAVPESSAIRSLADLIAAANKHGDARRGLAVYRSARFACISCHQVGAQGGSVGPALTDVSKRLKTEEIVEAILWPKRAVGIPLVFRVVVSVKGHGKQHRDYKVTVRK